MFITMALIMTSRVSGICTNYNRSVGGGGGGYFNMPVNNNEYARINKIKGCKEGGGGYMASIEFWMGDFYAKRQAACGRWRWTSWGAADVYYVRIYTNGYV
jgi:hypothetical protein